MINDLLNKPRIISKEECVKYDSYFSDAISDPEDRDVLFQTLHTFFSSHEENASYEMRFNFFRWYTELFWEKFFILPTSDVINKNIGALCLQGTCHGIDIWAQLMLYLNIKKVGLEIVADIYSSMNAAIETSKNVFGNKGGGQTIGRLVTQIKQSPPDPKSLRVELVQKACATFIQDTPDKSYFFSPSDCAERFVDLVESFLMTLPSDVNSAIEAVVHPHKTKSLLTSGSHYKNIQQQVLKQYSRKEDEEKIAAELARLAVQYKDDKIESLYYYDESDNQFHWNAELLKK